MKKILLPLAIVIMLLAVVLTGCQGGIAQDVYDQVTARLQEAQQQNTEYQQQLAELEQAKAAAEAALDEAQAKAAALEGQVGGLKDQYELDGGTKAEIAAKVVRNYHDTHVYSKTDMFVCGDMSSEVWNMLKAQGIGSVIVVGNKDTAVNDILLSNHAWVLAEVGPGEYLALETTSGRVMPRGDPANALYYQGWTFASPAMLKDNNNLIREYNTRVAVYNDIVAEAQQVAKEHNAATNPTIADRKKAVYDKLSEILEDQGAKLKQIESTINGLATRLQ